MNSQPVCNSSLTQSAKGGFEEQTTRDDKDEEDGYGSGIRR